ncbi:hypothetical protein M9H77_11350 [Catharanthus roseus]|uniref:Uncharacterized protein n=1 Tax=Catharanthus roseus TaxID=4058 RepID=A0ACC0BEC9_CATRO|nr:hypothetical protein M9H77_11350 [Catharanthus roseus]
MANARIARFVTEAAPPQFVSIMRQRASKMLDTIKEDEREFSTNDIITSNAKLQLQASSSALTSSSKRGASASSGPNFMSLWQQPARTA